MSLLTDITLPSLVEDLVKMLTALGQAEAGQADSGDLDHMEHSLILARSRVRTLKNAQQPPNRLAPEILSQIFAFLDALKDIENLDDVVDASIRKSKALLSITQVCRQWRYVALSTPTLWNHIHIRRPSDQAAIRSLSLSGTMPLVIYQFGYNEDTGTSIESDAFEMAMQNSHRLEELYIKSDWEADCVYWKSLDRAAPRLKSLHIIASGRKFSVSPSLPALFLGSGTSLERVCLSVFSPLPGNQFRNLKSLVLHNQYNRENEHLGFSQFLTAISQSPQLEELTLSRSGPPSEPGLNPPLEFIDNPICLPNLQTISLGCWIHTTEDVSTFLSCLRIPDSASRYLFASSWNDWIVPLFDLIQKGRPEGSPTRHLRKLRMVASRVIEGNHGFALEGDTLSFTSNIHADIRSAFLASGLLSDVEEFIIVSSPNYPPSLPEFQTLFAALPSLRRLTISGEGRVVLPRLTKALGLLDDPRTTRESPPCPWLESMDVLHYPDTLPPLEQDDTHVDALLVVMLAEQRAIRGYPLRRVLIERPRQEHVKLLESCVETVVTVKRWVGCPSGYFEQSILKEMHDRTHNPDGAPRVF